MTITEALAEIKLLNDKIAKKRAFVLDNLVRIKQLPDALASQGGTPTVISSEVQAITDLEARLIKIRSAIMKANLLNIAECNGQTQTLYDWLVWKREVASARRGFYEQIYSYTKRKLDELQKSPQVLQNETGQKVLVEPETALPYMEYATKYSGVNEVLNKLDGILSLKNATVLIELES
jgi:hypothetical protein